MSPALALIDLRSYNTEDHLANRLCLSKGRLMPDTKNELIARALKLSTTSKAVPRVTLELEAPGNDDGDVSTGETCFEQLFKQLHGEGNQQHDLTSSSKEHGEPQLWEGKLGGEGAAAFTDRQDIGGHFRTSIRTLCADLQRTEPRRLQGGAFSTPLFIHTPNFSGGVGDGEQAAEAWLPNPSCTSVAELERFEFIGKLCGAAARFTAFMEMEFPSVVWRSLLGEAAGWHDVQAVDVKTADYFEAILAIDDAADWEARQQSSQPVRWNVRLLGIKSRTARQRHRAR